MNKSNLRMVGPLKYVTDFHPGDAIYNDQRGHCFKASTSDGLVIINVASGNRIAVASTEMFNAVETV